MAKKTKKNKKAKRAKYTTAGRVDMKKGGRVKMARGSRFEEKMLEDEIQQVSVQPTKKRPTGVSITPPSPEQQPISTGGSDPRPAPMPDSNQPVSGFDTMPVDTTPAPLGDPRVPTTGGRKGVDAPRTPEELQRLEELSYVARGIDEDLTSGRGDAASIERGDIQRDITPEQRKAAEAALRATQGRGPGGAGPWWAQNGYDSLEAAIADGWSYDPEKGWTQSTSVSSTPDSTFQAEREERIRQTGLQAQQMAQGILPENIPSIPQPQKISREGTEITPEQAADLQMKTTQEAKAATVGAVSPEQVTTIDEVSKAAEPKPFEAATIAAEDISKVPEEAVVEAASGTVSNEVSQALANAAGIAEAPKIEAAQVQVVPGALQERVVGIISPEAKAQAAKVAGTSLARVTRAKKQLRNAGLSEEDIQELGNDPEALEARLTDFTEEQRGVVEGLPEEALVSNQIDSLLSGIEEGDIPPWAAPAVASVEAMLAQRGMSASTVGRDSLINAIITSALPIAQANAQAIQQSVTQQKSIEATAALKDAEMAQATALFNAQNVFQMDMAQFTADQQRAVNNSKFLQTVSLKNAEMEQQGILQEAVLMSQRNLAEADQNTKLGIENARAFLSMDMSNLNNQQQANVLKAQQIQQRLLSNQSATNAALQFNATSEQQTNQFMASLKAQTDQFNVTQANSMAQFNTQQKNSAEARRVANEFEAAKLDAQMATEIDRFNAAQAFAREQFNTQNATAIAQSNVQWRRQANTADTAAVNAVNQQNAQNAFGLTASAQNFLWQELRDEADYIFKRWDNDEQRKASLMIAALGNEGATSKDSNWSSNLQAITQLVQSWLD
jgi:hypothetical protein